MSIFTDLPAVDAVLNTGHADAANLIHAWLFNAGEGAAVHDYVDDDDGTVNGSTYSWAAGGGLTLAGSTDYVAPHAFSEIAYPYTVVAGLRFASFPAWQSAIASGQVIGTNATALSAWGVTLGATYVDGVSSTGPLSGATPYVLAWHAHSTNITNSWRIGNDIYGEYLSGTLAFLYIYSGEVDTDLMARLASDPYAMFAQGGVWAALLSHKKPHGLVRR